MYYLISIHTRTRTLWITRVINKTIQGDCGDVVYLRGVFILVVEIYNI